MKFSGVLVVTRLGIYASSPGSSRFIQNMDGSTLVNLLSIFSSVIVNKLFVSVLAFLLMSFVSC